MRFSLKDYQEDAVREVLGSLEDARDDYRAKDRKVAFALSALTGAGKTVMASAVFEALFDGSDDFETAGDPTAVVLWVTDDPNLNAQTRFRIMEASDRLDSDRLVIINSDFDAAKFEPGVVYFLNRQKLTAKTFVSHSDNRTHTLWETIAATIDDPERTLYLVLDEAHRGMMQTPSATSDRERSTTVLRLINGHDGAPPAPIVWGISATVERFTNAMSDARERTTLPNVVVDNATIQQSGLLKDTISLDLPDDSGAYSTLLARQAASACRESSELWSAYLAAAGGVDDVKPLLVVQVPNKPTKSEVIALLDAIHDAWPELDGNSVANVFGQHSDEEFGKYHAPYIAPQDVQDASHVRVLLAKDAISTGWDCPRAETLISLRPARDRTHIAQLLGRLIRSPLARRIESDDRLNAVSCFLPRFDRAAATEIAQFMTGAVDVPDGSPPLTAGRVLIDPETMLWNVHIPDQVGACFAELPSEAAPKSPAKPVKRLLSMAAELAVDQLQADPTAEALDALYAVLDGQAAQHASAVESEEERIMTAEIRRITADRLAESSAEATIELTSDVKTVDEAFKAATRALGATIANGYVKRLALADSPEQDFDVLSAKVRTVALASIPGVVDAVEDAAENLLNEWFFSHYAAIKMLGPDRQFAYDEIKLHSRQPQLIDLVVPVSRIEMTSVQEGQGPPVQLPTRDLHVLSDGFGKFPVGKLGALEEEVVDNELARASTVAWYRNPSMMTKDALQIPWWDGSRWRSMQPDFIFFSIDSSNLVRASIVDPHGHHLADALAKLLALADFGEKHEDKFARVEAISRSEKGELGPGTKGTTRLLDFTDPQVRDAVRSSASAAEAYEKAGQKYV